MIVKKNSTITREINCLAYINLKDNLRKNAVLAMD